MSMNVHQTKTKKQQATSEYLNHSLEQREEGVQGQQQEMRQDAEIQEQRLTQDVQALRMEDVEVLDGPLFQAEPTFARKDTNISRQRDPAQIERSKKKAGRKEAAADQARSDQVARQKLSDRVTQLQQQRDDPDAILEQTLITEELLLNGTLEERVDVTGHYRRKNAEKYAKSNSNGSSMRKAAMKDVENLVNNLRKDIVLEGECSFPEEVIEFTDAFYCANLYSEAVLEQKTRALRAMRIDGRSTPQDIEAFAEQRKKVEMTALLLKGIGSNFCMPGTQLTRQIRACQMARRQILDEGTTPYHMLMIRILDQQIAAKQAEYQKQVRDMRTINGTVGTPKGDAQLRLIHQLADIRRQMKGEQVTEEEKENLKDEAYRLIDQFNY